MWGEQVQHRLSKLVKLQAHCHDGFAILSPPVSPEFHVVRETKSWRLQDSKHKLADWSIQVQQGVTRWKARSHLVLHIEVVRLLLDDLGLKSVWLECTDLQYSVPSAHPCRMLHVAAPRLGGIRELTTETSSCMAFSRLAGFFLPRPGMGLYVRGGT